MKSVGHILQNYQPNKSSSDVLMIEVLIRRGSEMILDPPRLLKEMICQDCGSSEGHICLHNGKKAWFCGNNACMRTDSKITKERENVKWWVEFYQKLKKAEQRKTNKEWDGL